jgi:hypothetical protein
MGTLTGLARLLAILTFACPPATGKQAFVSGGPKVKLITSFEDRQVIMSDEAMAASNLAAFTSRLEVFQ